MGTVHHDAVWMEEYGKMLVAGGIPGHETYMSMYDPVADTWESTTGCNNGDRPGIVWTGEYELKWANNGYYDPFTDTCGGIPSGGAAPTVDRWFTTVWTGTEMIVWGGGDSGTNYGARYLPGDPDPGAGSWTATSTGTGCPWARAHHTAVWTDNEMIIWGGGGTGTNTGGRYYPSTNSWQATSTGTGCPSFRINHTAVWTGDEMIVWGGVFSSTNLDTGGRYDPTSNSWVATSVDANTPSPRSRHTAVWTGTEMIVFGGGDSDEAFNDGGHYNPMTDSWTPTATVGAPSPRYDHTAVWTGTEMIIWGGGYSDGSTDYYLADGAVYRCVP
jgi:N-acetylneuraminic acid mutarotase